MSMSKKGYTQGDMKPEVKDYQRPAGNYSQTQPGMTTEYISRQDRTQDSMCSKIKNQAYKGRYQ